MAMIQIRHVPDELHRKIKSRAAEAGLSMSDYLLREIEALEALPTQAEFEARLAHLPKVKIPREEIVAALHEGRAGR